MRWYKCCWEHSWLAQWSMHWGLFACAKLSLGNLNWVILRFWYRKCTHFFLGPRSSDFGPKGGCASSRLDHSLKVELISCIKAKIHTCTFSFIFWRFFRPFFYIFGRQRGQILRKRMPLLWKKLREGFGKKAKIHRSFLIFSGVAGSRGIGRSWPFERMGNVNWVILGFRPQKCTQFFLGPRFSDFGPKGGCASSRLDHGLKV